MTVIFDRFDFVLIETLWNVKFFYDGIWRDRPGINRNIVECKVQ